MTLFAVDYKRGVGNALEFCMVPILSWDLSGLVPQPITLSPIGSFYNDLWTPVYHGGLVYDREGRVLPLDKWQEWAEQHIGVLEGRQAPRSSPKDQGGTPVPQHHVRGTFRRQGNKPKASLIAFHFMGGLKPGDTFTMEEGRSRVVANGGAEGSANGPRSFLARDGWIEVVSKKPLTFRVLREFTRDDQYRRLRADGTEHAPIPPFMRLKARVMKYRAKHGISATREAIRRYAPSGLLKDVRRDDYLALWSDIA